MDLQKRKRLEKAGWRVGSVAEFLDLSKADAAFIEVKLALSQALADERERLKLTQVQTAKLIGSSQSRVAKMEAGDPSVSTDLLIRALLSLGATSLQLAKALRSVSSIGGRRHPPRMRPAASRSAGS